MESAMIRSCIILCLLKYIVCEKIVSDIVSTTTGDVQGIIKFTEDHVPYTAFLGIPFGEIPKRFQEAQPKKRFNFTLQCFNDGPVCMQTNLLTNEPEGSEDCLNLNLFTPLTNFSTKPRQLLPVLFWIHGGGFLVGSADSCKYGPDGFIYHGVIFVSVNYRLGVFGWTFLQDSRLPGDAGLKDQLLALHWVRDNIAQFGGDPERITLGGHSVGSISATAHAISDRSKGLFHQIIAISGTICNSWGYHTQLQAELIAFKLGQLLNNNVPVTNTDDLIKLLNEIPSEMLSLKLNELILLSPMRVGMDTYSPNNTAFLTKCYYKKLMTGKYKPVPTMIGFSKNEILFFLEPLNKVVVEVKKLFKKLRKSPNLVDQLISASFEKPVTDFIIAKIEDFSQIVSQIVFHLGIDECQRAMCSSRNSIEAPIYYYLFNYDAKEYSLHYQRSNVTELNGAGHEDEMNLIFNACPKHSKYPKNPHHPIHFKKKQMRALVANFVKYGNPTPFGSEDQLLKVTWPDSCFGGHHLLIEDKLSVEYKRPIGNLTRILTPFEVLKESFQSDCFDVDNSDDDFEPVLSLETTFNTFRNHLNSFWDSFWKPQKHMLTWEKIK